MTENSNNQPLILAVDDSPLIHRVLERRLEALRARMLTAMNGEEAMVLARAEHPDLIMLDIGLPDMSGFEALSTIKNDPEIMHIPVIILTASDSSEDKVLGFELGAVDYVTKPFDTAELQARVRSVLRIQHLVKMLEQKAQVDALTGLWNRAHLDQSLLAAIKLAERHDQPLSLMMCDLDHFKRINDAFGHSVGDRVLERFAQILMQTARESDVICRYGGEEFVAIQPMTDKNESAQSSERMRAAVENEPWEQVHDSICVTASFGAACLSDLLEPTDDSLLLAADRALYQAKEAGRNQVALYRKGGQPSFELVRKIA